MKVHIQLKHNFLNFENKKEYGMSVSENNPHFIKATSFVNSLKPIFIKKKSFLTKMIFISFYKTMFFLV
jgi:hypothetical protein